MAGFQQVKVNRELIFTGTGNNQQNVTGNMMMEKVYFHDHFIADADESDWVEEDTNGCTTSHSAANGGATLLTLGATNDDCGEFSHTAQWSAAKNCVMEARVHTDIITDIGLNIGWVDADMSTNDQICFEITAAAATLVNARVTDGAAFVFDTDGSVDVWYCAASKADTEGTPAVFSGSTYGATTAPVASTFATFRVALDTDGDATFFYNGSPVGYLPACTTAASLLTPYVAVISRTTEAKVVTVDRITCWQDE